MELSTEQQNASSWGVTPLRIAIAAAWLAAAADFLFAYRDSGFGIEPVDRFVLFPVIALGPAIMPFCAKNPRDLAFIYVGLVVTAWVGVWTVCPCTAAHFFVAPPCGLAAGFLFYWLAGWLPANDANQRG